MDPSTTKDKERMCQTACSILKITPILLSVALAAGCELFTEPDAPPKADIFEIHLQSWPHNTLVKVVLDSRAVFEDTITTGDVLALAARIPLDVTNGRHQIRVKTGAIEADTVVSVQDTLYVGVNYYADQQQIYFWAQRSHFAYR